MAAPAKSEQDRVVIFDTTLRDGEQCPGATMTHEEKLEVAELLDQMGVDVIEAGFPIASEGDFAAVREIAKRTRNAVVCGLSRASFKDIDRCAEAIEPAEKKRIHTFISTSPVHMKYKLQKEPHEVYEMVIAQVTRARTYTNDVEWSCEDGTRTEHDFLCRCVEAAINAGATTINIPDTVGYTVPEEYFALIKMVRDRVPNSDRARFSAHCHDDLGMAVANSLAGVRAGIRQIECTINGIGERAGNASLAEVVMAIKVRNDVLPYWTNIDGTLLTRASKLVAAATSFPVQYNKAIVGRNAFAHESGIHQAGMLKHTQTYAIKALMPHEAVLELYQVHAVTQGTDAQAEVSVRLAESGRSVTAKGADPDTLVASAKAYLGALNKLMSRRGKGKPEPVLAERRLHSTDVG